MSVTLKLDFKNDRRRDVGDSSPNLSVESIEKASKTLHIGLINNMPDSALEATERQFLSLLASASEGLEIVLSLHSLPGIPRGEATASRMSTFYSSVEVLWDAQLDGVIVTGREPLTENLTDEPYWESFTKLIDWAESNTHSSVWSCLAAHAAVLYMDGVSRVRNGHKHSGIFDCVRVNAHPLFPDGPLQFKLPHSRWNGLREPDLTACGYQVITRAAGAGVDTFVKQSKSLFVFFQGHPEYEANDLLLEYRRDIGRYLSSASDAYPLIPRGYFDSETEMDLAVLEQKAKGGLRKAILEDAARILDGAHVENIWQPMAVSIYRNWVQFISARKKLEFERRTATMEASPAKKVPALAAAKVSPSGIYPAPSTAADTIRMTIL